MASFADFTAAPPSLQTWSKKVPTDLARAAELELLRAELLTIEEAEEADATAGTARARKAGRGANPRKAVLVTMIEEIEKVLEASEASLTLRVLDPGEWLQFVEKYPAADEGEGGHTADTTVTRGWVSAIALLDNVGRFIVGWNDEKLPEGAWTAEHTKKVPPYYLQNVLQSIVDHHQRPVTLPKSSTASSTTGSSATN